MSLHVTHNTLSSRESRDALPCVHGMRPALGGCFIHIDWSQACAEIGHPDLPRQRERPRVHHPGAFCFRRSQGRVHAPEGDGTVDDRKTTSALRHPAASRPKQGRPRAALGCAVP